MPVKNKKINIKYKIISIAFAIFLFFPVLVQAQNLAVPFTPQAPYGIWTQPWQDACEETSIVMVNSFYQNIKLDKQRSKQEINSIFKIKNTIYGKSLDENAQKITDLINNFLPWSAEIVNNPTIEQFKEQIDLNQPIIIPAYGKALKNPHFKNGGPIYHVLVISGYDDDKQEFITKDPGTKHGLDFHYKYATIMDALHDYLPKNNTKNGSPVAIFTKNDISDTNDLDGDHDGLTKGNEISYGSVTWLKDSDGDGFLDGIEVKNGYSPTKKFEKL